MRGVKGYDKSEVGIVQRLCDAAGIAQRKVDAGHGGKRQRAVQMRSIQRLRVILIQFRVAQADLGNGATRVWHWAHGVTEARQSVGVQVQRIDVPG